MAEKSLANVFRFYDREGSLSLMFPQFPPCQSCFKVSGLQKDVLMSKLRPLIKTKHDCSNVLEVNVTPERKAEGEDPHKGVCSCCS